MKDSKTLEQVSIVMSVDSADSTEDMTNETTIEEKPDLSIITAPQSADGDSECKTSSSRVRKNFSPSETIVKTLSPIVSPAIYAAKTVIPKVERISFRTFCGLSFKVALP